MKCRSCADGLFPGHTTRSMSHVKVKRMVARSGSPPAHAPRSRIDYMHISGGSCSSLHRDFSRSPPPKNPRRRWKIILHAALWSPRRDAADETLFRPGNVYNATQPPLLIDPRTSPHGRSGLHQPIAQSVPTITVAGILLEGRATARIPHILRPCFGSPSVGRAANDSPSPISSLATSTPCARRNASNTAHMPPRDRANPRHNPIYDLAGRQYDPSQAAQEASRGDGPPPRPDTSRDAYRRWANKKLRRFLDNPNPPVTAGHSRDAPRTPGTVHILGNDRRASFLAWELRQVYDSVHVLKPVDEKLVDFKFGSSDPGKDTATTGARDRQQDQLLFPTNSEAPITNLITTARGVDAVAAIDQLKDRISDRTTLCLMSEGLGLAEELNETVFNGDEDAKPEYLLGRLDRGYLRREKLDKPDTIDRPPSGNERGLIHVAPLTKAQFSPYDPALETPPDESPLATSLIDELKKTPNLEVNYLAYHNWLHLKLKEMVIYSVVDPVAAVVGCRYQEATENKWAMHLMMMILEELRRVIAVLPEVRISARIRMLTEPEYMRKALFERLRRLPPNTGSMMGAHIRSGWKVDINAHNGYFIRRGKKLGVECPYNEMVVAMVKAKYSMHMKERDNYVPFEITSRPHGARY